MQLAALYGEQAGARPDFRPLGGSLRRRAGLVESRGDGPLTLAADPAVLPLFMPRKTRCRLAGGRSMPCHSRLPSIRRMVLP